MLKHKTRAEAIQAAKDLRETEPILMGVILNHDGSFSAVSYTSYLDNSACHAFSLSWLSNQNKEYNEWLDKTSKGWWRENFGQ